MTTNPDVEDSANDRALFPLSFSPLHTTTGHSWSWHSSVWWQSWCWHRRPRFGQQRRSCWSLPGEHCQSRGLTKGKHLWIRNNGSTLVSQLVDTTAVILITHFYAGALPIDEGRSLGLQLALFIVTGYVFKFLVALLDTPVFVFGARALARYLRVDEPGR